MVIKNLEELDNLAGKVLENLPGNVLALSGDLGVGKTTFTQLLLKRLGVIEKVTSPTFVILKKYDIDFGKYKKVWHMDCYRLDNTKELEVLGFKEIVNDSKALVIIEWAEKIKEALPQNVFWMNFKHGENEGERIIEIKSQEFTPLDK